MMAYGRAGETVGPRTPPLCLDRGGHGIRPAGIGAPPPDGPEQVVRRGHQEPAGPADTSQMAAKQLTLRRGDTCNSCGTAMAVGVVAVWDSTHRTVTCMPCSPTSPLRERSDSGPADGTRTSAPPIQPARAQAVDAGVAGASARREYERRLAGRQERVRPAHPVIGAALLAWTDPVRDTEAWRVGAIGEERVGAALDRLPGVSTLHDRRIPRRTANIDHLVVGPGGVYVIDTKRYVGQRPSLVVSGGLFSPRIETLHVGRRSRQKLVDGIHKQVAAVREALSAFDVPVTGVLCFVDGDWPLIGGSFTTAGVHVLRPRKAYRLVRSSGPLKAVHIASLQNTLAQAFRPS